jgi:hypothetical protein
MKGKTTVVGILVLLLVGLGLSAHPVQADLSDLVAIGGLSELVVAEEGFYMAFWSGPATYPLQWSWYLNDEWTPWEPDYNMNFMSETWAHYTVPGTQLLGVKVLHNGVVYEAYKDIDVRDDGRYIGLLTLVHPEGWTSWTASIYFPQSRDTWLPEKYLGEFPVSPEEVHIEDNIFMNVERGIEDNEIDIGLTSKTLDGQVIEYLEFSGYTGAYVYLRASESYWRIAGEDEPAPTEPPTPANFRLFLPALMNVK